MRNNKTMEFIWKGIGFGANEGVLTHVLNDSYDFPPFLDINEQYNEIRCFNIPINQQDYENW